MGSEQVKATLARLLKDIESKTAAIGQGKVFASFEDELRYINTACTELHDIRMIELRGTQKLNRSPQQVTEYIENMDTVEKIQNAINTYIRTRYPAKPAN